MSVTGPARYVRLVREHKEMSQHELSAALGWKHTRVSDIEREICSPTAKLIRRISAAMGMTEDEFYSLGSRLSREDQNG